LTTKEYNSAVSTYADGLFRFALSRTRNSALAEDLVQETFAKVWVARNDIKQEKSKSYLFTTVNRLIIDHFRKSEVQEAHAQHSAHNSSGSSTPLSPDVNEVLHEALARLPEVQQTLVLLRDYEGYNYQEMAEICQITEAQVKVNLFRARKKLKTYLVRMDLVI